MSEWAGVGRREWRSPSSASKAFLTASLIGVFGLCAAGSQDRASESVARVRRNLDEGHYEAAEAEARELVRLTTTTADPAGSADLADLLVESLWRNGRADATAVTLAEDVLARRIDRSGDDGDRAASLTNLGQMLALSGDYPRAIDSFTRSLTLRENERDPKALSDALDDLARAMILDGKMADARPVLDRSFQLRQSALDQNDTGLATTLELLALWHQRKGEYSPARPLLERALLIRRDKSPDHPALATTLGLLGDQLWFEGSTLEAAKVYREALAVAERTLRPDHPDTALALKNLATAELEAGAIAESLALRRRAHAIMESNFGRDHLRVAGYLNDLANGHMAQQDYRSAQSLLERALSIRERHFGVNHESVATIAFNLAFLAGELGDVVTAERQIRRAVVIWTTHLGPEHPFVARAWDRLAETLLEHQRSDEALVVAKRALSIYERALGPDHVYVARTVHQLAVIAARSHRTQEAEALARRADAIWEKASPDGPGHAMALYFHAETAMAAGNYAAARTMYERAGAIRQRIYGTSHLDVARTLQGLAAALAHLNEPSLAFTAALRAETAARTTLRTIVRNLSERRALQYSDLPPSAMDLAVSLLDAKTAMPDVTRALDSVILGRGVILDEMAARQQAAGGGQIELKPLWARVAAARQRVANLAVRAPSDARAGQYITLVEAAHREKEAAERALAETSAEFKQELERGEVGVEAVRHALTPRSALVSFLRYDRTTPSQVETIPHYAAFVLVEGKVDAAIVQLGAARTIERAVALWRAEAAPGLLNTSRSRAEIAYRIAGDRLRNLVWDPLAPHLADVTRVFVVPDGTLNVVNLGALPVGPSEYLVERHPTIHYLPTERDLVAPPEATAPGIGLFAIGGPNFDVGAAVTRGTRSTLRGAPCGTLQSLKFGELPGTLREATEISGLWKAAGASAGDVHLSVASEATERTFKRNAPGRRVLHLATHGFFLGSSCEPSAPGTRAVGGVTPARTRSAQRRDVQNPLLASGLAFAGANQRARAKRDQEDGILTAEEISAMNLQGTEWAVLSACDTGLGEVKAGEGVFGLRRAFQIAGVRTVIMSLWSVEDEATRQWMHALYDARLNEHLDTAESVRAASLHVLRDRRAKRLSTHPFYWGAFVAAGAWQ